MFHFAELTISINIEICSIRWLIARNTASKEITEVEKGFKLNRGTCDFLVWFNNWKMVVPSSEGIEMIVEESGGKFHKIGGLWKDKLTNICNLNNGF